MLPVNLGNKRREIIPYFWFNVWNRGTRPETEEEVEVELGEKVIGETKSLWLREKIFYMIQGYNMRNLMDKGERPDQQRDYSVTTWSHSKSKIYV